LENKKRKLFVKTLIEGLFSSRRTIWIPGFFEKKQARDSSTTKGSGQIDGRFCPKDRSPCKLHIMAYLCREFYQKELLIRASRRKSRPP